MAELKELIAKLNAFPSPALSNALDRLSVQDPTVNFSDPSIRCLFPDLGIMTGVAITVEIETMNSDADPSFGPAFVELIERVDSESCPVVVVAKEVGSSPFAAAHTGEIIASSLQRLGAIGLFTDAAIRDVDEIGQLGFHAFAKGTTPSKGNARLVRVGETVEVGGLNVSTGDIIHGDSNGVLKVPTESHGNLAAVASQVVQSEGQLLDFIKSDEFTLDQFKAFLGFE